MDFKEHVKADEAEEGEEEAYEGVEFIEVKLKGILKKKANQTADAEAATYKAVTFDEQNLMETFHPMVRDHGSAYLAKTPFYYMEDTIQPPKEIDMDLLTEKLRQAAKTQTPTFGLEDESDDDEVHETEDEKVRRLAFQYRRKKHYNEFLAVGLARQLIAEDLKDISDEEYDVSEIFTEGSEPIIDEQMEEAETDLEFDNTSKEENIEFLSCKERARLAAEKTEKSFCQSRAELDAVQVISLANIAPSKTQRSSDVVPLCGPRNSTGTQT